MGGVEVLVLHGSPGSGKTTLARTISELLRVAGEPHAVIDLDDLSMIFPNQGRDFARDNLRSIWPNYARVPSLKAVIPSVIADADERVQLELAVPAERFLVCELVAPRDVLEQRVTDREPTPGWQQALRDWIDVFHRRGDRDAIRDLVVSTHDRSEEDAAREVLAKARWLGV